MKKAEPKQGGQRLPSIHFRITAAEYRHLQAVAKAMDRSVAYLIAKIVHEWLEGQHPPDEEPKK